MHLLSASSTQRRQQISRLIYLCNSDINYKLAMALKPNDRWTYSVYFACFSPSCWLWTGIWEACTVCNWNREHKGCNSISSLARLCWVLVSRAMMNNWLTLFLPWNILKKNMHHQIPGDCSYFYSKNVVCSIHHVHLKDLWWNALRKVNLSLSVIKLLFIYNVQENSASEFCYSQNGEES